MFKGQYSKKAKYSLKDNGVFVIENYNFSKPFSSFFPGIAGLYGIPMWVFYVNRAQGISSFGVNTKDHPISEFLPANKAYQQVGQNGFRTFLKINPVRNDGRTRQLVSNGVKDKNKNNIFYEPFVVSKDNALFKIRNRMLVDFSGLGLEEENLSLGLEVKVDYFTIPGDNFAALARVLTIKNTSSSRLIELIDGLPVLLPYGLNNMFVKEMNRTIEAWMRVENLENCAPFYRLKVEPTDRPEVAHIEKGNFSLSFYHKEKNSQGKAQLLKPIVDPSCVFGSSGVFTLPGAFLENNNFKYPKKQVAVSKTPCSLSFINIELEKNQEFKLYSLFGNMDSLRKLEENVGRIASSQYLESKKKENKDILNSVMSNSLTVSSSKSFNLYAQGTFLDNVLRGGLPVTLNKTSKETIYVYSRKHGDLERDYNYFVIAPSYFSQGNGNYRDINQNRRNDVYFNPDIKDKNISTFLNLIQLDGFNPLVVKGVSYSIENPDKISDIIDNYLEVLDKESVIKFLSTAFYIGDLLLFLEKKEAIFKKSKEDFIRQVVSSSSKYQEAQHGEGFWTDHWTYNLDLIESYLSVYPENFKELFFERKDFTFYDDYWQVNHRGKRYQLYHGKARQLKSVYLCKEKQKMIQERKHDAHKVRVDYGKGDIYQANLVEKLVCIIVNKLSSLDPFGIGIEMEADKPNWYDSLNGLPAFLGSSVSETMELKRLIVFLKEVFLKLGIGQEYEFVLAEEIYVFYQKLFQLLKDTINMGDGDFIFWDKSAALKERYREETILGLSGNRKSVCLEEFLDFLEEAERKVKRGIGKTYNPIDKTYSTYFINEIVKFVEVSSDKDTVFIKPLKFTQKSLPLFLEGFVHAFKILPGLEEKKALYETVRKSALFDKKLQMYKVNACLDAQPEEIGRTRVFSRGWLENESVWLHMEYKYLLELLKSGLYDEFYKDFSNVLVPFQNPERYGRSILENSSFIVSSVFPDINLHGTGFVARLSGSTAEFLHIWILMNIGKEVFFIDANGSLCFKLNPALDKSLFTRKKLKIDWCFDNEVKELEIDKNCYAFNLFGKILVVYHNPKRLNTYGNNAVKIMKYTLEDKEGKKYEVDSEVISQGYAYDIRDGKFVRIDVYLE